MSSPDKVLLFTACKAWEGVLEGVLQQHRRLGIRQVELVSRRHSQQDPGMRISGPELARSHKQSTCATHAILALDHEGSGHKGDAQDLEAELQDRLQRDWGDRAIALVAAPELEEWLVGASAALAKVPEMRLAPRPQGWWRGQGIPMSGSKPLRPKEAIEAWLKLGGLTPTSSIYRGVAEQASLSIDGCQSRTFRKLRETLTRWFPLG